MSNHEKLHRLAFAAKIELEGDEMGDESSSRQPKIVPRL